MPGETNRVSVQFEREATFNTIPGSPNMTTKEVVSESLTHNKTTTRSQRIRSDAQVPDWIETAVQATGGLNDELSYAAHDDFIEASMRGTYAATALSSVSGTSMTASTRRMTKTGANWNATGNIIAGQAVNISGFSTAANNGIKVVKTVTDDYVEFAEEETGLGDESGATVAVATAKRVINSTTARSYYIQKSRPIQRRIRSNGSPGCGSIRGILISRLARQLSPIMTSWVRPWRHRQRISILLRLPHPRTP